jgi:CRP-like cAMP-binding protein
MNKIKDIILYKMPFLKKSKTHFSFLKKVSFLEDFSYKDFYIFQKFLHERTFQPAEVVFHQGDLNTAFFFLFDGKLEMFLNNSSQGFLVEGDYFGEDGLSLSPLKRPLSVKSTHFSKVLVLLKDDLIEMKLAYPLVASKFLHGLLTSFLLKLVHE